MQICSRTYLYTLAPFPVDDSVLFQLKTRQLSRTRPACLPPRSSIITILFPIFASFKALRSGDPSQLAPWLMYWVVLSALLMAESWTYFIVGWYVPMVPSIYAV